MTNIQPNTDLGVIVNDIQPDPEEQELQNKIEELELSRINLRVSPVLFDRLSRVADFKGISIEQHCLELLKDSLDQKIGEPIISGPSKISGATSMKVTGPSFPTGGRH